MNKCQIILDLSIEVESLGFRCIRFHQYNELHQMIDVEPQHSSVKCHRSAKSSLKIKDALRWSVTSHQ